MSGFYFLLKASLVTLHYIYIYLSIVSRKEEIKILYLFVTTASYFSDLRMKDIFYSTQSLESASDVRALNLRNLNLPMLVTAEAPASISTHHSPGP